MELVLAHKYVAVHFESEESSVAASSFDSSALVFEEMLWFEYSLGDIRGLRRKK